MQSGLLSVALILTAIEVMMVTAAAIGPPSTTFEALYSTLPSAARIRESLRYYTSQPHMAGSLRDYETAVWTAAQFTAAGIPDVRIESIGKQPFMFPVEASLSLL